MAEHALPLELQVRARRSYETGRLARALTRSLCLAPLVWLSSCCCSEPGKLAIGGMGLVLAVTYCLWRGEAWQRGVKPGILAGGIPMLAPVVMRATNHLCVGGTCLLAPTLCILAGLTGGIALGVLAPRPRDEGGIPFFVACLIAGFAGSVGCFVFGLIGVGGMALGFLAGATPVLATRRSR
ncbi:MAG TPA: hypothetical protein VFW45_15880 [Candidatus Polarisedimenticolia bacterium]|nr:hypothetical protein [Candidatus Polarisedimenticolia bacterium]